MNRLSAAPAAAFIIVCGVLLAWPIVTGGWLTYLDNPAHVAEIHSLAFDDGGGWSDIAWLGYPLGRLHSPIWYGGFAQLVRNGLALGPVYGFLVVLGFLTPPLVLLGVSWRRVGGLAATLLAWLLLTQKTHLVGFGSPLGGMWTFTLSCGAFLLLADRLVRREDRTGDLFWIAGLYGFIGLTHLFTIVPAVILFGIHAVTRWRRGEPRRFLLAQGVAAGLGALASAAYWAPLLISGEGTAIISYNLTPLKLVARLLLATPVYELVKPEANLLTEVTLGTALPQILLVAAGIGGFVVGRRRGGFRLGDYGMALAVVVFAILMVLGIFQMAGRDITILGHVSWRLLTFVRLGLALAALPLLKLLGEKFSGWKFTVPMVVVLALATLGLGAPLRAIVLDDDGAEMKEIRALWTWLEENQRPDWGRVYLQDPFGSPDPLGNSHVMALTRLHTGVHQVGPLYAGSPFPTVPWLVSESRKLFGVPMRRAEHFNRMLQLIPAANTTRMVLQWPDLADEIVKKGYAQFEYRTEMFAVLALVDYPQSRWAEPIDRDVSVLAEPVGTGRWRVVTEVSGGGGTVLVKESWSPHWTVVGEDGPVIDMHDIGLIRLSELPAGRHVTMLEYRQPRWPDIVSGFGWGLWLVLLVAWRVVPAFRTAVDRMAGGAA